ncbi:hypothetical protein LOTGIDRAFT_164730 [Lottia gigantea]|uniref:Berberine/berberine-like domain-containing protein n=1 Tax=Lottia gigantea TaxID=225164 RepID=V4BLR8_LOTGI|nr:hypothetical protein LOTGIDRAFT_164730 [Lottia gigantea]ESO89709.1 hypothetical protein LOTGIDRAFT_164730 [Lottia gigantea]
MDVLLDVGATIQHAGLASQNFPPFPAHSLAIVRTTQVDDQIETLISTIKVDSGVDPTATSVRENATFWGYESGVKTDNNAIRMNLYLMNVLIDDDTDYDAFTDLLTKHSGSHPISSHLRRHENLYHSDIYLSIFKTALHSESCYLGWDKAKVQLTESVPKTGGHFGNDMLKYGKAVYFEPTECLPGWKNGFWGEENYARLLAVKKKYDPRNLFVCFHCVGCGRNEEKQHLKYRVQNSYLSLVH